MTSKLERRVSSAHPLQHRRGGKPRTLSLQLLVKTICPFLRTSLKAIEPARDNKPNLKLHPIPPAKQEQHRQTSPPAAPLSRSRRREVAASPPRVDMRPISTFEVFEFDDEEFWKVKEMEGPRRRLREVVGGTGDWVEGAKVLGGKGRVAVVCLQDELENRRRSTSSTTPTPPSPSSDLTPQPSFKRPFVSAPIHSLFASASSSTTSSLERSPSSYLTSPSSVLLDYHLEIDLEAESPLSSLVSLSPPDVDSDTGPITPSIFVPSSKSNATSFSDRQHRSNASTSSTSTFESEKELGPRIPVWMIPFGGRELVERKQERD